MISLLQLALFYFCDVSFLLHFFYSCLCLLLLSSLYSVILYGFQRLYMPMMNTPSIVILSKCYVPMQEADRVMATGSMYTYLIKLTLICEICFVLLTQDEKIPEGEFPEISLFFVKLSLCILLFIHIDMYQFIKYPNLKQCKDRQEGVNKSNYILREYYSNCGFWKINRNANFIFCPHYGIFLSKRESPFLYKNCILWMLYIFHSSNTAQLKKNEY